MQNHYLEALRENLLKKEELLSSLISDCEEQKKILSEEEINWEAFDGLVESKDDKIGRLVDLDTAFETLYGHVKEELEAHRDLYKEEIIELKKLISSVSEKSVSLEALEQRNYRLAKQTFGSEKKKLSSAAAAGKAAQAYHNNMNKLNLVDPQLMDQKK